MVFVGGCAVDLLLNDPAAPIARVTTDVDAVVAVTTITEYQSLAKRLRKEGFSEDSSSDVICRWRHRTHDIKLDILPTDASVFGFTNPWYEEAVSSAVQFELTPSKYIRLISAPAFIATKLAAFHDRGGGDWLASHDLEDILTVIDGRSSVIVELSTASPQLQNWVSPQLRALLSEQRFIDALPGLIEDSNRSEIVIQRLWQLVSAP